MIAGINPAGKCLPNWHRAKSSFKIGNQWLPNLGISKMESRQFVGMRPGRLLMCMATSLSASGSFFVNLASNTSRYSQLRPDLEDICK